MAIKKRPRVGTILGTENRNDDDLIERTPGLAKYVAAKPVTPPDTVLTAGESRPEPAAPRGPVDPRDGNGSGDDGRGDIDSRDPVASDDAGRPDTQPAADTSTLGVPAPNDDLFNDPQISEMAAAAASRSKSTNQGVPGLPDPIAAVDDKTPAEANATATKGTVNDPDMDTTNYSETTHSDTSGDTNAPGNDTMGTTGHANAGGETQGGSGTDGGVGDGSDAGPGGAGDAQGASGPGEGPGGIGGAGSAGESFHKGGQIKGKNPKVRGEDVTIKAKEGENILNVPASTILGKDKIARVNKIALMKNLSREEKARRVKRTIVS